MSKSKRDKVVEEERHVSKTCSSARFIIETTPKCAPDLLPDVNESENSFEKRNNENFPFVL